MLKIPSLTILLPAILLAWLVGCVAVNGAGIFVYLAMHAATTGVFAALVWRTERARVRAVEPAAASVPSRAAVKPERVPARDQQAAVA